MLGFFFAGGIISSMMTFPKDFLWGAATSAHQVEGGNTSNDWWRWEQSGGAELSGAACDQYNRYKDDFDIVKRLGHNCHRFSIEWSRVQPEAGRFSDEAIAHYRDMAVQLHSRGIEPVVTLHHFTNPQWFVDRGGWFAKDASTLFSAYVSRVVEALKDRVRYWVTVNEPLVYTYYGFLEGRWPPHERSLPRAFKVMRILTGAHNAVYRQIHGIYRAAVLSSPRVGYAQHMIRFMPASGALKDRAAVAIRDALFNFHFVRSTVSSRTADFIGVNYYTRNLAAPRGWNIGSLLTDVCGDHPRIRSRNSLGWEVYPEGLYDLLLRLKRFRLPVFILENGICTDNDAQRWDYIRQHVKSVALAIRAGVPVAGYLYWSLLDNFEWDKGFAPRFGLVEVDYATQARTVRDSALKFAQLCRSGQIDI
jgi:beta-glucosidase